MGSACCVAARDHHNTPLPSRDSSIARSPAWNRSRGRVAEEVQNVPCVNSGGTSLDFDSATKDSMDVECGSRSERQSRLDFRKSPSYADATPGSERQSRLDFRKSPSYADATPEPSVDSGFLNEAGDITEQPPVADCLEIPQRSMSYGDSSAPTHFLSADSPLSWQTHHSPGYCPPRQVFVGQQSNLKSSNSSISQKRASFILSPASKDLTVGSQGGASSDNWSMSTFSELMASSQRDRWSFDTESLDCSHGKVIRSKNNTMTTPSTNMRTCGVCLKLLIEKSPWVAQKFTFSNELSVVAVLFCGHVFHAECLENTTPETSKFDPPCPLCTAGDKQALKMPGRTVKLDTQHRTKSRKSRNRIIDSNLDSDPSVPDHRRSNRQQVKSPMLGSSSSVKKSLTRPLRRHFSLGSKSTKPMLDNECSIKSPRKGFWAKYLRS